MKKVLSLLPVLGLGVALAGCGTTIGGYTVTAPTAAQVQSAAVALCKFEPSAASVAALLTNNGSNAATASALAGMICQAVAGGAHVSGRKLGGALPTVNGVVIKGQFVQ